MELFNGVIRITVGANSGIVNSVDISRLTDDELLARARSLASAERGAVCDLVEHLAEIDRRKLNRSLGYPTLFEYCVYSLGYSEGATYRRIRAARAIQIFPPSAVAKNRDATSSASADRRRLGRSRMRGETDDCPRSINRDQLSRLPRLIGRAAGERYTALMIQLLLMATMMAQTQTPARATQAVAQFQPCVWPNRCATEAAVPVQPCVWPNTCAADKGI